jgi:hypothetical protein
VERGCLIDLVALTPAVWTATNSFMPLLHLYYSQLGPVLVLGPAAVAVVVMLNSGRSTVRKDGGWDSIFVANLLALLYGLAMLYWWTITPATNPL